jgi:membrane associated rhomboid family serine protease
MLFDVLLFSAIVTAGYLGQMVLRRLGPGQRTYGWMLIGDVVLAIAALVARERDDGSELGTLLGTIAIGGALCLVMLPPLVRDLGRRAAAADRLRLARALCDLRELLQPGMGARHERELLDTIIAVRDGRVDDAIAALVAQRQATEHPLARRYLDERIALTLVHARRWDDAIAVYQRALATGASPQLEVEMVRAYCEVGQRARAAELALRLVDSPLAEEPAFHGLLTRARLVFLAFAGRPDAVEAMIAERGALGATPEVARRYWIGLARLHAGDRDGARQALEASHQASRTARTRELAEAALARIDGEPPPPLEPEVAAAADRLSQPPTAASGPTAGRRAAPAMAGVPLRAVPVTAALLGAILAVAVYVTFAIGDTTDIGVLMAAGGNLKPAVEAGERWRLVSSIFLHGGAIHLLINSYSLWVLGKLVEQLYGSARTLVVFVAAGVGGAAASVWLGGPSPSVGASGAVFGLVGAALAELLLHRARYPQRWARTLIGTLGFIAIAQLAIDFYLPIIDQAAHMGGLVTGLVTGALLSIGRGGAASRGVAAALAAGAVAVLGYGGFGAMTGDLAATLRALPTAEREVGGLAVALPEGFVRTREGGLYSPGLALTFVVERQGLAEVEPALAAAVTELVERGARKDDFARARPAAAQRVAVAPPWQSREVELLVDEAGDLQYRAVVFGRAADGELWLGLLSFPAGMTDAVGPMLGDILASAKASEKLIKVKE